jgi:CRISPR/Cas system-associated exonuclease Cas4 (RecB family)
MAKRLFDPAATSPFALSRSKVELFLDCPRCFYLDRRLGIARPPGFPFNLNSAVDALLKKEFDRHRAAGTPHPLMLSHGVDAVPHAHPELDAWRQAFKGVRAFYAPSNFEVFGAIDDLWRDNQTGALIVADYKATSKDGRVGIDADWQVTYKRQMEFYQWLLRRRGLEVSRRGYFVYCNGRRSEDGFDGKLLFDIDLIPYDGDDGWIDDALRRARELLMQPAPPPPSKGCAYCTYALQSSAVRGRANT